jgi:hypothetical protein
MHKTELIGTTLAGIILLSGCSFTNEANKIPITETVPFSSLTPESLPTPTSKVEQTPTATTEANVFAYSKDRLFNNIPSYDYFKAHPEKVAWAPYDPWTQPEEFKKWLNGDLVTILGGDLTKLEPNVTMNGSIPDYANGDVNFEHFVIDKVRSTPFRGQSIIFGVKHDGVEYPVVVTTIQDTVKDATLGVHAVLLFDGPVLETLHREGTGILSLINDRNIVVKGIGMFKGTDASASYPDAINELRALGFDAFSNGYSDRDQKNIIGFGPGYFEFYQ